MNKRLIILFSCVLVTLQTFAGCSWNLDVVDYTPLSRDNWEVSTPAEQGLDSALIAELYFNAAKVKTTVCWLSKMVT